MARERLNFVSPLLIFLLILGSCQPAYAQESRLSSEIDLVQVFDTIPDDRSLLTSPQFFVIDDFNDGKKANLRGALWRTKSPAPGALDLTLVKEDARNPDRGYSMNARYNLSGKETASFQSFLNRLDASDAAYLVFKCRIKTEKKDFSGRLRVSVTDWRRESVIQDITESCPANAKEWGDVILPMKLFKALDFDQLFLIEFFLIARDEAIRGELQVDELAFFGFNDVSFESNRDNLIGYPRVVYDETRREELLKIKNDKKLLREIAKDTWKFFDNARDRDTFLIVDHIRMGDGPLAADYTSPTNVAMDILATIAAYDLGFISKEESVERIQNIFRTLQKLRRFLNFFYNFYDTKKLDITRSYLSSVDNGWLAIALVVARQAFPKELNDSATAFLDSFSFSEFLDPENNQLVIGFEVPRREFGQYHYGMLVTEARAISYYAIGKGDIPKHHWLFLYRTAPAVWKWQSQKPKGKMVAAKETDYFQGYYEYLEEKFVPSWGGSLFEFLMPTIVIKEKELAKKGLGLNNKIAVELHRDYALIEKGYPAWGIAPAAVGSGRTWKYEEFGVPPLGAKGYRDRGVVAPYVTFLALDALPKDAVENIRTLLTLENIYGEYGLYDSFNFKTGKSNPQYLALDQGISLIAICNYLKKGSIKKRFHKDAVGKGPEELLDENFF